VRLDPEILDFLATRAEARGTTVNQLINQLLKNDIESIRAAAGIESMPTGLTATREAGVFDDGAKYYSLIVGGAGTHRGS